MSMVDDICADAERLKSESADAPQPIEAPWIIAALLWYLSDELKGIHEHLCHAAREESA